MWDNVHLISFFIVCVPISEPKQYVVYNFYHRRNNKSVRSRK